jgi:hypothetical protein
VARQDLSAQTQVNVTLGYAGSYTVVNQAPGIFTALPAPGQVVRQGQAASLGLPAGTDSVAAQLASSSGASSKACRKRRLAASAKAAPRAAMTSSGRQVTSPPVPPRRPGHPPRRGIEQVGQFPPVIPDIEAGIHD